jgi:AcrR family transcriptional regulator
MKALETVKSKGELTRAIILQAALQQASVSGFESLTIGTLAEQTGLSKSGLFAHFGSKEELQLAALDESVARFNQLAFIPALAAPRGLPRMRALFQNWLDWTSAGELVTCPLMAASAEFDRRDGAMRDAVERHLRRLNIECMKMIDLAKQTGDFVPNTDTEQMAFELFGIIASCNRARNLFRDKLATKRALIAFERLVTSACPSIPAAKASKAKAQKAFSKVVLTKP